IGLARKPFPEIAGMPSHCGEIGVGGGHQRRHQECPYSLRELLAKMPRLLLADAAAVGARGSFGSRPELGPCRRRLVAVVRMAGAAAHGVLAGNSRVSESRSRWRAGLSAKAARASRCPSASFRHAANQTARVRKSADRSLRPERRSLSAVTAASSCGIAETA